jgi:hypothetical protein
MMGLSEQAGERQSFIKQSSSKRRESPDALAEFLRLVCC